MPRSFLSLPVLTLTGILYGFAPAGSGAPVSQAAVLEIDDFDYVDTSGEPTNAGVPHQTKLQTFMTALRRDFEADDRYRLALSSCIPPCAANGSVTPDRLRAASHAGTNILVVGGIQKMSTLVQWAKVSVIDVGARRILFERLYTFRGDNDEAWRRAETFVSREIREKLAGSPPSFQAADREPTTLAVFAFELEDTSAAAPSVGEPAVDAADAAELTKATDAVRQMLAQSPRYRVIDVSGANTDAVKARVLRDCGGCDTGIALGLGADQSLVGVIRRISRTEYTVRFQVREARTGAVVASADSGLRMGANYSWSRGAVRLIRDRLL
jgi:hypothetical protein